MNAIIHDIGSELAQFDVTPPFGVLLRLTVDTLARFPSGATRYILLSELESQLRRDEGNDECAGKLQQALARRMQSMSTLFIVIFRFAFTAPFLFNPIHEPFPSRFVPRLTLLNNCSILVPFMTAPMDG